MIDNRLYITALLLLPVLLTTALIICFIQTIKVYNLLTSNYPKLFPKYRDIRTWKQAKQRAAIEWIIFFKTPKEFKKPEIVETLRINRFVGQLVFISLIPALIWAIFIAEY